MEKRGEIESKISFNKGENMMSVSRFKVLVAVSGGVLALASSGVAAQTTAQPCELHIWPAERMNSVTTGWLSGFGMIGALADSSMHAGRDSSNKAQIASALDSQSQLVALQSLDLSTLLTLKPGTIFVTHEKPLERKTMNSIKTRRSDSTSACYSELVVADVAYQKSPIYGRSLRTLFMFRDFGTGQKIGYEYKAWGGNGLKLFPPKEGEDAIASIDELVGVFKKNFAEYSNNARKALATRKRA
jgi:hypothetical protein